MAAPSSPCTGVCKVNLSGICIGCGRLLGEIAEWPVASDTRRRTIVELARQRRRALRAEKKR